MLRGFRHTLFLLLQVGVLGSGVVAWWLWPEAWRAVGVCVAGAMAASLVCERIARSYLRSTLGRLRRAAEELGRAGRTARMIDARPGDDFHKLVGAINLVAARLADATRDQQRLHDELRRREQLAFIGELAAAVAHEVNNPLDGVQNCVRILRRCEANPQRAAEMLDLIDSGLKRIALISSKLLALGREKVIHLEPGRLGELVESAVALVRSRLDQRGLTVRVERRTDDDHAAVDPALLEQVFVNLMLNAADCMSEGAVDVVIRRHVASESAAEAAPSGPRAGAGDRKVDHGVESVCVDVCDRGSGIPPDVLPHIFEPFFTTKAAGRGTGLGLAVAARIVGAHHGSIQVAPRPGGGTVFSVRLPARMAAAARPAVAAAGSDAFP